MSFLNGLKKIPDGSRIEAPVQPIIYASPLRYVYGRKKWQVDVGEALKNDQNIMFYDGIVPFESRNRNETIYGQSSHKSFVNKYVRYPLINGVDLMPLSRRRYENVVNVNTYKSLPEFEFVLDYAWDNNKFNGIQKYISTGLTRRF